MMTNCSFCLNDALYYGPQSLTFHNFDGLMTQVKAVASVRQQPAQPVAVS